MTVRLQPPSPDTASPDTVFAGRVLCSTTMKIHGASLYSRSLRRPWRL